MGFLLPAALVLLSLALPLIILYMLKLRRREQAISSSILWRQVLLDRTANAPWQRLRRNILLVLQLLLLVLLVLSLARPFFTTGTQIRGDIVVVIDASASINGSAQDGGTRWEKGIAEIERLIEGLGQNSKMSIIWAGPSPLVAAPPTSDREVLRSALHNLKPSAAEVAPDAALTLAAGSARQMGLGTTVAFVSDGSFSVSPPLPNMPGPAAYLHINGSPRNLAITAFSLREAAGGPEAFASIYNSGELTATALLSLLVDGVLRDTKRVEAGLVRDVGVTFAGLPLTTEAVELKLSPDQAESDTLELDNHAWVVRTPRSDNSILLVTEGNGFLEKALTLLPGVRLSRSLPAGYSPSNSYSLTVFDGSVPPELPEGNLLFFAPTTSPLVPVSGTLDNPVIGQIELNDPLLRFVDLSGVHLSSAVRIEAPTWARVLVRAESGDPLLLAGEVAGRRVVVFGFDLHRSDLPLRVAFPILMSNLAAWLLPGQTDALPTLRAGEVLTVRVLPEADNVQITTPEEAVVVIPTSGKREIQFAATTRLGIYTVRQTAAQRTLGDASLYAVNLFSRGESNIAPRRDIQLSGSVAQSQGDPQRTFEIWPWLLLTSLLLLGVEWWVYNRGGRRLLPRRIQ